MNRPRTRFIMTVTIFVLLSAACVAQEKKGETAMMIKNISWFGHASIRITADNKIIYIDPLFYDPADKADIILITHLHDDHYVRRNVEALMKKGTIVVAPVDLGFGNRVMKPGTRATIGGIPIEAVPAYNVVKTSFHPKSAGNNGYIITVGGVRIYQAGDTERIPEMKYIACDIALVPLGQTYTFNSVDEAVQAVLDVKAKIAIPIHYGMNEGTKADALRFAELLGKKGVTVEILKKQ